MSFCGVDNFGFKIPDYRDLAGVEVVMFCMPVVKLFPPNNPWVLSFCFVVWW